MCKFLTDKAITQQLDEKGMYKVLSNELFKDLDGSIYLVWAGFETDNFTWINSSDWDIRCSHLHDVGCKYHQIVRVKLTEYALRSRRLLFVHHNRIICKNIPNKYLEVVDVTGFEINNIFYRMLKASRAPKYVQLAYRAGVAFNLNWFLTGKEKIDLNQIYDENWNKSKPKKSLKQIFAQIFHSKPSV